MAQKPNLDDYIDVRERMAEFFEKYPQGSFQSECNFTEVDGRQCVVVKAYAFRTADDPRPGCGLAYEFVPGRTPYTKDSELQNAETAAWGRAVVAVGAGDTKRSPIASAQEVRNRTAEAEETSQKALNKNVIDNLAGRQALRELCERSQLEPEDLAAYYKRTTGHDPKTSSNDELLAFVNSVQGGVLTLE